MDNLQELTDALLLINQKYLMDFNTPKASKKTAMQQILQLAAYEDGQTAIKATPILKNLLSYLTSPENSADFADVISSILLYLCEDQDSTLETLSVVSLNIPLRCVQLLCSRSYIPGTGLGSLLCNLSADEKVIKKFFIPELKNILQFFEAVVSRNGVSVELLQWVFAILNNLTQDKDVRHEVMYETPPIFQKMPNLMKNFQDQKLHSAILGVVFNCCYLKSDHKHILEQLQILPTVLLPLAGPEKLSEEENTEVPELLRNLDSQVPAKERDPSLENRKQCMQILYRLCTLRECREYMREKNAYAVLRGYHLWEEDSESSEYCEDLVNVLIRKEDEFEKEDLEEGADGSLAATT